MTDQVVLTEFLQRLYERRTSKHSCDAHTGQRLHAGVGKGVMERQ